MVRLCCPVRGPICAIPSCAPAGTMCARRVLSEPRVVYVRRKSNLTWDLGIHFTRWYGCAALYVGIYVQSRIVLLPGLWALDVCCPSLGLCAFDINRTRCAALYVGLYVQFRVVLLPGLCALDVCWPSLGLCAFNVNRTQDVISVYT